jgi:DNA-binding transcriptional ArsR family regulator
MLEQLDVRTAKAASVFASTRIRNLLLELVGHEHSLKELSVITGMGLSLLHYHLRRLEEFGLIAVARTKSRAGRPVKYYRAAANAFFVPSHLARASAGDALAVELRDCLERVQRMNDGEGTLYSYRLGLGPTMRRIADAAASDSVELWSVLKLSRSQAAALAGELRGLIRRYQEPGDKGRPYLVHAALTPR